MGESVPRDPKFINLKDRAVQILLREYYTEGIKAQTGRFRFTYPSGLFVMSFFNKRRAKVEL